MPRKPSRARQPDDDVSLVVGATRLGRLCGKSARWGRRLLGKWAREQLNGGRVRVFLGAGGALFTTIPVVHDAFPSVAAAHDPELKRRLAAVEALQRTIDDRVDAIVIRTGDLMRSCDAQKQRMKAKE